MKACMISMTGSGGNDDGTCIVLVSSGFFFVSFFVVICLERKLYLCVRRLLVGVVLGIVFESGVFRAVVEMSLSVEAEPR